METDFLQVQPLAVGFTPLHSGLHMYSTVYLFTVSDEAYGQEDEGVNSETGQGNKTWKLNPL